MAVLGPVNRIICGCDVACKSNIVLMGPTHDNTVLTGKNSRNEISENAKNMCLVINCAQQ